MREELIDLFGPLTTDFVCIIFCAVCLSCIFALHKKLKRMPIPLQIGCITLTCAAYATLSTCIAPDSAASYAIWNAVPFVSITENIFCGRNIFASRLVEQWLMAIPVVTLATMLLADRKKHWRLVIWIMLGTVIGTYATQLLFERALYFDEILAAALAFLFVRAVAAVSRSWNQFQYTERNRLGKVIFKCWLPLLTIAVMLFGMPILQLALRVSPVGVVPMTFGELPLAISEGIKLSDERSEIGVYRFEITDMFSYCSELADYFHVDKEVGFGNPDYYQGGQSYCDLPVTKCVAVNSDGRWEYQSRLPQESNDPMHLTLEESIALSEEVLAPFLRAGESLVLDEASGFGADADPTAKGADEATKKHPRLDFHLIRLSENDDYLFHRNEVFVWFDQSGISSIFFWVSRADLVEKVVALSEQETFRRARWYPFSDYREWSAISGMLSSVELSYRQYENYLLPVYDFKGTYADGGSWSIYSDMLIRKLGDARWAN